MIKQTIVSMLRSLALAMALAGGSSAAQAGLVHVTVDTSSFGVASGYLDLQLSASGGVPLATAVVSNMVGFGAIDLKYGVTTLANGFGFRNDVSNYLSHAVTFGGLLSFDLTFDGESDPLTAYVTHFVISAFDLDIKPLGDFDPDRGALADISWTPSLGAGVQGNISVEVSDSNVTVVPEPGGLLLIGAGLAALALGQRRRSGRARDNAA